MKKLEVISLLLLGTVLAGVVLAAQFKLYPGATLDEQATKEARAVAAKAPMRVGNLQSTIYTTNDSFENVCAFYKGIGKEYVMPYVKKEKTIQTDSGKTYKLQQAYFILDGAADLMSSKAWVKIQRPCILRVEDAGWDGVYKNVRDVSVIILSQSE